MLILSRKMGESICSPGTNTTISIHRTSGGRVTLAIEAPQEVAILRGELIPIEPGSSMTAIHSRWMQIPLRDQAEESLVQRCSRTVC